MIGIFSEVAEGYFQSKPISPNLGGLFNKDLSSEIDNRKLPARTYILNLKEIPENIEEYIDILLQKYKICVLGKILKINPRTESKEKDLKISFLPMECISDIYGEIINHKEGNINKSKGYTRFQEGDLIWAKITPCMQNGKSAIVQNLKNELGYGSTEFYVIRNESKNINIEYIYNILRMQIVRMSATHHFTGTAGQQRVPVVFLKKLQLPLPPLEIQNKIAMHISNLKEQIKTLRTEAKELKTNAKAEFEKAVFEKANLVKNVII